MIFLYNFFQGCAKVTNQGAADASGIHLTNFNSSVLQESAINTDLAKLVLDQYNLLTLKCLFQKLLNKSCFTGSKETGNNIYLYHFVFPLSIILSYNYRHNYK